MAVIHVIERKREHYEAIGRVTVFHTYLQYELARGLELLLGVSRRHGELLSSQLPFTKSLAVLNTAGHDAISDPLLLQEFLTLLKRAAAADDARNRVVHSIWAVPLPLAFGNQALRQKLKATPSKPLSTQQEVLAPKAIHDIGDELKGIVDDLSAFWSKVESPPGTPT